MLALRIPRLHPLVPGNPCDLATADGGSRSSSGLLAGAYLDPPRAVHQASPPLRAVPPPVCICI